MIPFDSITIMEGSRLAKHLLKECRKETPPAAVIASAMTLVQAAQAAGVRRMHMIELLELLDDDLKQIPTAPTPLAGLMEKQ